ncbi:MAG: aspartate/glutamate racemase family protein [Hydrogenophaga sp.]|nr:aspartate/glutamate racemase family protein [Hydrogenophaga sp.]
MRIALIHALAHSVAPINDAMASDWPEAVRMNLLDDSLSVDLARTASAGGNGLDAAMHQRFEDLCAYAEGTGAQAILFTCSAFGPCIEAAAARRPHLPVLKPNEAMVADAVASGVQVGLIASFAPTLQSMPAEFPASTPLRTALAEGAMAAMDRGDGTAHDEAVWAAAQALLAQGCRVIALAQFSMARAAPLLRQRLPASVPVLTTPDSAVAALRRRLVPGG